MSIGLRRMALAGAVSLLVGWSDARAEDTVRLNGKGAIKDGGANLSRLDLKPDDAGETIPVWHRHFYGGGYHGGFYGRSFYGGGFYNRGYYGGFNSFYRPSFGFGLSFYRPFYPSYYYGGYNSFYSPYSYYSYPSFSFSYYRPAYYGGFFPCCDKPADIDGPVIQPRQAPQAMPQIQEGNQAVPQLPQPQIQERIPQQNLKPAEKTYPYDGGPANPVPMPPPDANPSKSPKRDVEPPLSDRAVSLPGPAAPAKKKYAYAAYGEKQLEAAASRDDDRKVSIKK